MICLCCSGPLLRIGEDVSERLDIVPAQVRVLVIRRPKYACRACEDGVVQAPAPARLIEGGLPTDGTVAQVALIARWLDPGLPWAAAIALGAIVAPPDAAAATTILRTSPLPRRPCSSERCSPGLSTASLAGIAGEMGGSSHAGTTDFALRGFD